MKKNKTSILILLIVCLFTFTMGACTLKKDDKITLKVGGTYNWYQGEDYTYSSSDKNIASVDEFGVILGVSYGECTIYARKLGVTNSIGVSVLKNAVPSYPSSIVSSSQQSNPSQEQSDSSSNIDSNSSSKESSVFSSKSEKPSSTVVTSSSSQSSSSSALQIYFTLNANGGTIQDSIWEVSGDNYITYQNTNLPTPQKTGYNFLGWYNNGTQITSIVFGGSAYAVWEEQTFAVEYILTEGQNNPENPTNYGYFDEPFALLDAIGSTKTFIGWFLDSGYTQKTTVIPNTKQKVTLYGKFATIYTATFNYNGLQYPISAEEGQEFKKPNISVEDGYFIEWFTEQEFTYSYNFALKADKNINLYGKLYTELTNSFFGYDNNKLTKVNNMTEFQYYLEYTFFNNVTDNNSIEVSESVYNTLTTATNEELTLIINKTTMPFITLSRSNWVSGGKYYYEINTASNFPDSFYTQTLLNLPQYDYAQLGEDKNVEITRQNNFDNFKYLEIDKEVSVTNSNQLFFALEHRLKPIPLANSSAEIALNKCKDILREIINDDMSDLEKVLRIYRYLCYTVTYNLPNPSNSSDTLYYDAFYAEGVLNNSQAVCDGISKTFSLLCNIEGIRCVRTASTSHAWNEVFINGNWYTVDATHGNANVNSSFEVLTHDNFLINETNKKALGYDDFLRTDVIANGEYNYYSQTTFTFEGQEYDFIIESRNELVILLKWVKLQDTTYNYNSYTIDFVMDYYYFNFSTELSSAANSASLSGVSLSCISNPYKDTTAYILLAEK